MQSYGCTVDVYDPWVASDEAESQYGLRLIPDPARGRYDSIVVAVRHNQFREMGAARVCSFSKTEHVLYDLKCLFAASDIDLRL